MAVHSLNFQTRGIAAFLPSSKSSRIDSLSNACDNFALHQNRPLEVRRRTLEEIYVECVLHSPIGIPVADFDFYCHKFGSPSMKKVGAKWIPVVSPKSK